MPRNQHRKEVFWQFHQLPQTQSCNGSIDSTQLEGDREIIKYGKPFYKSVPGLDTK